MSADDLFTLEIDGQELELYRVTGRVAVCELFAFQAFSVSGLDGPDVIELLGKPFSLRLKNDAGETLCVHGVVTAARCELGDEQLAYEFELGPDSAPLSVGSDCYVFQKSSVDEIVKDVLDSAGLDASSIEFRLRETYPKRAYVAQYLESDWDFIERLLSEEGIYYFFEFGEEQTKLVFADASTACEPLEGAAMLPCREVSALQADFDAVYDVRRAARIAGEAVRLVDYDYEKPSLVLDAKAGDDQRFELYDFPGRFAEPARGTALAKTRLEALQAGRAVVEGRSAVLRLLPGRRFELSDHPLDAMNAPYFCVSTDYTVLMRAVGDTSGESADEGLRIAWRAIPAKTPFRPAPQAVIRGMPGPQMGVVCGPSGSELHTSDSGQIRVQHYWDRAGKRDQAAATWVRTGQFALGNSMILPRIGWEVLVEHHAADADEPFVSTHVYEGEHRVPYPLPANKTRTAWQTATTPSAGSANEIRFEDSAGSEEIFLNASKDMAITVGHCKDKKIGANHRHQIGVNSDIAVGSNNTLGITKDQKVSVGAVETLTVSGARGTGITGSDTVSIGALRMCTVSGGHSLTVNSGRTMTVGAAMMDISALGVNRMTLGSSSVTVGGAWISAAGTGLANTTIGASSETVGGAKIQAGAGGVSLNVKGALAQTVGAAMVTTAGGNTGETAGSGMKVTVGGAFIASAPKVLIEAENKICIKVGGASITITKSSIEVKAPSLASPGATIAKDGSKISHN
jgi:type VI secretion system secreted protein VgrG